LKVRIKILARALALLVMFAAVPAYPQTPKVSFAIIVADDVEERTLSREALSFVYQRKQSYWKSGKRIQPVNLPATNSLRRAFSACVLGEPPEAMENYWREMYFHGSLPPHVLESEEAVLLFVDTTPGAIGYVSVCPPHMRARVILTFGDALNCPKRSATCIELQDE
jgi:hypothetical protein